MSGGRMPGAPAQLLQSESGLASGAAGQPPVLPGITRLGFQLADQGDHA
jgi:hypothetical protein